MELEQLKDILNEGIAAPAADPAISLRRAFRQRSTGIVWQLKNSLRMEIYACIIFLLLSLAVLILHPGIFMSIYCGFMVVYSLVFLAGLLGIYRKVRLFDISSAPLVPTVSGILAILRRYTSLYYRLCLFTVPLFFGAALIAWVESMPGISFPELIRFSAFYWYSFATLFWMLIMHFFARWYLRLQYGRYMARLEQTLLFLNEGD